MTNIITEGTIIHGTMRPQDLIPAFMDALRELAPAEYEEFITAPFAAVPAYVQDEGDDSSWWDSIEADILLEELFFILNDIAPEDMYFGVHPGDGSDYGFWAIED